MGKPLHALMIGSSENDPEMILGALKQCGYEVDFERVETTAEMQARLAEKPWDIVLNAPRKPVSNSEDIFGTAFHLSPIGICVTGLDGRLRHMNQSLLDMLGFMREELEGKHFNDITYPEDWHIGREAVASMIEGNVSSVTIEKRYVHKNGEPVWALVTSSLLRDPHGQPLHFIAYILNINARKQAEAQIRSQAVRLQVLADVSQLYATAEADYQAMLEVVARHTAEALNSSCGVRLLSEDGERLEIVALYDADPKALEVMRLLSSQPLRADESHFVQRIMQSDQAILMPGVSEDQVRSIVPPEHWPHLQYVASQSRLIAPMRTQGDAIGFLILSRKPGDPGFDEQDETLAQQLADRAALSISNARLFRQLQNELSERKQAENARSESQSRFAGIIDSAMDAIITIDEEQHITMFNPAAEKIFRYSAKEILGETLDRLLPEKFRAIHREHVRLFGETDVTQRTMGALGVLRGLRADGEEFPIEASISHLKAAGQKFFTVILRDISERQRAQEAVLESEARYQRVLDAMMEGCQIIDYNWRYVYVNDVVAAQGKNSREDLVSHTMMEVYPGIENTELFASLRQCMEGRIPKRMENQFIFPDGSIGWFELSIQPAREGIFILSTDITERKRAEEALIRTTEDLRRSNKELEQFAYISSHDLQEPLRMVSSYVQLLARRYKGKLDPNADEFIAYAVEGATRMQQLINDLLTYSRIGSQAKPFTPTNLESVLKSALSNLQIAIEENKAVITHDPLPTLMADHVQMVQLFQNLIGNAIKFRNEAPPRMHIGAKEVASGWQFSVSDNGIGIDPQFSERIFIIFQRLHTRGEYEGTGIGLAICKKIVERHGGRIWVEAATRGGAIFHFIISEPGG